MQLAASISHQTLQPKRTHDIQPMGGRLATPLFRATAIIGSHRQTVISNVVMVTWMLEQHWRYHVISIICRCNMNNNFR